MACLVALTVLAFYLSFTFSQNGSGLLFSSLEPEVSDHHAACPALTPVHGKSGTAGVSPTDCPVPFIIHNLGKRAPIFCWGP
jgi:hypothetical protein